MSSRASGGTLAACIIVAAMIGFGGGAYVGATSEPGSSGSESDSDATDTSPPAGDSGGGGQTQESPASDPTASSSNEVTLTLSADTTTASSSDLISLSGTITPPIADVVLQVQRNIDGSGWTNFPVEQPTEPDGTFSMSVSSQQTGVNSFRVVRSDNPDLASPQVDITIS